MQHAMNLRKLKILEWETDQTVDQVPIAGVGSLWKNKIIDD